MLLNFKIFCILLDLQLEIQDVEKVPKCLNFC
jgi:hypothetical protein